MCCVSSNDRGSSDDWRIHHSYHELETRLTEVWACSAASQVGLVAVAVHKGLHVGDSGAITYAQDGEEIDSGEAIQVSRIAFGSCT